MKMYHDSEHGKQNPSEVDLGAFSFKWRGFNNTVLKDKLRHIEWLEFI